MAQAYVEHVNITVSDPERTARMLESLFGWTERWRGPSAMGGRTIHVGTDSHYVAIYTPDAPSMAQHAKGRPLNHVGVVVDDLDDVEGRAIALGLHPFSHGDYEPGRRFYLFDADGIEWEMVSYAGVAT
jgi:glyoxylase I family protein